MSPDELVHKNMRVVTGEAGLEVLLDYHHILQDNDMVWSRDFGILQDDCLPIVIMAMADSWRRLVLPFSGMPWCIFRLIDMDEEQGTDYLRQVGLQAGSCPKCQDCFFGLVSQLTVLVKRSFAVIKLQVIL